MARIVELVAKLTGQLHEGTRINVLVQQQQEREAGAASDLRRLTMDERIELARLLAKAKGADEMPPALPAPRFVNEASDATDALNNQSTDR